MLQAKHIQRHIHEWSLQRGPLPVPPSQRALLRGGEAKAEESARNAKGMECEEMIEEAAGMQTGEQAQPKRLKAELELIGEDLAGVCARARVPRVRLLRRRQLAHRLPAAPCQTRASDLCIASSCLQSSHTLIRLCRCPRLAVLCSIASIQRMPEFLARLHEPLEGTVECACA